jgi:hypothetical protein
MYAAAHTSFALAAKRQRPAASLLWLMVTAQAAELLWVLLSYAGIERSRVTANGTLHLDHLPYSHSLLVGLGGGIVAWAIVRWSLRRPDLAAVFGMVFASHIVLDVLQHEPDIRLLPWMSHPTIGLNLQAAPWLDFAVETAFCVACWAYYRGSRKLLTAIIALNVLNLPLMVGGQGNAQNMATNPAVLPTVIVFTIVLAWAVIYRYAKPQPAAAVSPALASTSPTRTAAS